MSIAFSSDFEYCPEDTNYSQNVHDAYWVFFHGDDYHLVPRAITTSELTAAQIAALKCGETDRAYQRGLKAGKEQAFRELREFIGVSE